MKRLIVCLMLCFLLTSCSNMENYVAPVTDNIKFNLDITYYNENYKCSGEIYGDEMTFKVTEPEELNGMEVTFNGDEVSISYKGLTYSPSDNTLPTHYVCSKIYNAIEDIKNSEVQPKTEEENYTISGKADTQEYIFTFSPAGYPLNLKLPSDAFYAEFSDVSVINK